MFTDGKVWCQTINYSLLACYRWKQNWKSTSGTDFMAFLVKALFRWTSAQKMLISAFWATSWQFFSNFFLDIEKFYQIPSTYQFSDQLDHPNRNYRGGGGRICPPPAILICKKPGLFRVKISRVKFWYHLECSNSVWLTPWPLFYDK